MPERPRIILGIRRGGKAYETLFEDPDAVAFERRWNQLITDPAFETIERYDCLSNALRQVLHPAHSPAAVTPSATRPTAAPAEAKLPEAETEILAAAPAQPEAAAKHKKKK